MQFSARQPISQFLKMLEYSLKKQLSKSLPQCKQRVVTKTSTLVQFWHPCVPTYLSVGWFILVFLSGDMWPCHNLLSKMCEDLYLSAKALKTAFSFPLLSVYVHHWENTVWGVRHSFLLSNKCCICMDGLLRLVVTQQKMWSDCIQGESQSDTEAAIHA